MQFLRVGGGSNAMVPSMNFEDTGVRLIGCEAAGLELIHRRMRQPLPPVRLVFSTA